MTRVNIYKPFFSVKNEDTNIDNSLFTMGHYYVRRICLERMSFYPYKQPRTISKCISLKTYAAISNAHLYRVCKRGKLSGSCLSTLNGFGSTQLPIFLCHIGVPMFSSQNN